MQLPPWLAIPYVVVDVGVLVDTTESVGLAGDVGGKTELGCSG